MEGKVSKLYFLTELFYTDNVRRVLVRYVHFVPRRVTRSFCSLGASVHRSFGYLLQLAMLLRVLEACTRFPTLIFLLMNVD
jgi:hypothetical protein